VRRRIDGEKAAELTQSVSANRGEKVRVMSNRMVRDESWGAMTVHCANTDSPPSQTARDLLPHLKQRIGDLPERANPHCIHELVKHVAVLNHRLLQRDQHRGGCVGMLCVKGRQTGQLRLLFFIAGTRQFDDLGSVFPKLVRHRRDW